MGKTKRARPSKVKKVKVKREKQKEKKTNIIKIDLGQ